MLFALREARRLVRTAPLSELVIGPEMAPASGIGDHDTKRLTAALAGQVWSYHHPVGTCAMGADPAEGAVVDAGGRVHGIRTWWSPMRRSCQRFLLRIRTCLPSWSRNASQPG